jgi:hypothetical protein
MRTIVDLLGVEPTRQSLAVAGLVVANVCFLFAAVLLAHLTTAQIGPQAGRNAALLFCVSPFSFFFNAGYSESLFVMLVLASLYLADRERWGWAAIAAGLASGTRPAGLALLPALLLQGRRARAPITAFGVIGLLAPSGSLLYFVYSAFVFGDPLAYFKAQAQWGGWNEHVWYYVTLFLRHPSEAIGGDPRHLIILLNLGLAVAALVLLRRLWSSSSVAVALFTTLIVVAHTAISWVSLGRYLLSAVGLYMVAGELLTHPRLAGRPRDLLLIGSTLLLAMLTLLFAHGFWIV